MSPAPCGAGLQSPTTVFAGFHPSFRKLLPDYSKTSSGSAMPRPVLVLPSFLAFGSLQSMWPHQHVRRVNAAVLLAQ